MDDRVLDLKQWLNLLGGELDYDYGTTEQPNGMAYIHSSRISHPVNFEPCILQQHRQSLT